MVEADQTLGQVYHALQAALVEAAVVVDYSVDNMDFPIANILGPNNGVDYKQRFVDSTVVVVGEADSSKEDNMDCNSIDIHGYILLHHL